MIFIIHGNDLAASRDYYAKEKDKSESPILMDGDGLTYDRIFQALENKTIFDSKITLAIENFFSKNKSNSLEFKKITEYLNSNKNLDIFFWESTEISKTNQTILKNSVVKIFSYPQLLFQFLDNLKPENGEFLIKLVSDLKKNMEIELVFFMIVRQFRLMISQLEQGPKIEEAKRLQNINNLRTLTKYQEGHESDAWMKVGPQCASLRDGCCKQPQCFIRSQNVFP